jgi:hypothetical protein
VVHFAEQRSAPYSMVDRKHYLATRFDHNGVFGTVVNRFVIQVAAGEALTVFANGGQTASIARCSDRR